MDVITKIASKSTGTSTTTLPGTRGNGVEVETPAIVGTDAVRETGAWRSLPPGTPTSVPQLSLISTRKDWTTMCVLRVTDRAKE